MSIQKKKILVISLFALFSFNLFFVGYSIQSVKAEETLQWDSVNIDSTWLAVKANPFVDKHTNDGTGQFRISSGGIKLVSFTNEGKISESDTTIAYRAAAEFEFSINWYTTVEIKDVFPQSNLGAMESVEYVHIIKYEAIDCWTGKFMKRSDIRANINYRSIDFGPESSYKYHDYDGNIPINLDIREDFEGRDILINGRTIKNLIVESEIKQVVVSGVRYNILTDYDTVYQGNAENVGSVSAYTPDEAAPSLGSGAEKAKVTQTIENLHLGVILGDKSLGKTFLGGATGKPILIAQSGGTIWSNPISSDVFNFNLPARIRPKITYDTQTINVRWAQLTWDYHDWLFSPSGVKVAQGPLGKQYVRNVATKVTNQFCHQTFKVRVNFVASGEMVPIEGGPDLDDPVVDEGDFVWDEDMTGTTDVDIIYYRDFQDAIAAFFTLLPFVITIIVIIVIIIAIFYVYMQIKGPVSVALGIKEKISK